MNGVVEGGWGYVISAYAVSWVTWGLYVLYLRSRTHQGRNQP